MHWYFLISSYYLTVSLYLPIIWLFPYIFLLFDCFEWALIDRIKKQRVHSELWQFQMEGRGGREGGPSALGIYMFSLCTGISLYLPIIWLFPYIFLLFDCFEWALIDRIKKQRVHSELWQFQMEGREGGREGGPSALGIYMFSLCTGISLYLPIIWLFPYIFLLFDCFEWALIDCIKKQRVHSELWQFQMGGGREGSSVLPG